MRIGRFEIDERDARARLWLAGSGWVPRRRLEAWTCRALARHPALARPALLGLLGQPDSRASSEPSAGEALEAVRAILREDVTAPLSLLAAEGAASARRMLFLWRGQDPTMLAVAKIVREAHAAPLEIEAAALARVAPLGAFADRAILPRVLARGVVAGCHVLVLSALPGEPLLRRHRLGPALAWPVEPMARLGSVLGALHGATLGPLGALLHGDAWSRNVLAEGSRLTGLVDWEASRTGDPAAEIAGFLRESARADIAGRGSMPPPRLEAWPPGARALVDAWAAELGTPAGARERIEHLLSLGSSPPIETGTSSCAT